MESPQGMTPAKQAKAHVSHERHPFRLFYLLIASVVSIVVANVVQEAFSQPSFDFTNTLVWRSAIAYPFLFWPIVAFSVVAAVIGWQLDRQYQAHRMASSRNHDGGWMAKDGTPELPLARALRREALKLGDNEAANFRYVTSPIQDEFDATTLILKEALLSHAAMKGGAVIIGEANAGKTRLAFEALQRTLLDWYVLIWRPEDKVPAPTPFRNLKLVIFIDDLQEHVPAEVSNERGVAQALDTRAIQLKNMLQVVRAAAIQAVVIATCRTEDETRVRGRLGWLFDELAIIRLPHFAPTLRDNLSATVVSIFAQQGARHVDEWDGTVGSVVLGLATKNHAYLQLVEERQPAVLILHAMKLLTLIGLEQHTLTRLRAICGTVFRDEDLGRGGQAWDAAISTLLNQQFASEIASETGETQLLIRKDIYFERVIDRYPDPQRPTQLDHHLSRLQTAFRALRDSDGLLYLGNAFFRRKRREDALAAYEEVLQITPHLAAAWRNKGSVLSQLGRLDDAMVAFEQAIHWDPNYAAPWREQGDLLRRQHRPHDAEEAYRKALAIDPRYANAWNGLGNALGDQHRYEEAITAYDRAIAIDPKFAYAWRNRGDALVSSRHRFAEALRSYDEALALTPNDLLILVGRGNVLSELRRYEEARRDCERAEAIDPNYAPLWRNRGNILRGERKYDEALEAYERAITLQKHFVSPWRGKGEILRLLGRMDEARAAFKHALVIEPDYARAWMGLGQLNADQHAYGEALQNFEQASALTPTYPAPYRGKGDVFAALKRYDEALAAYDLALSLDPDNSLAWSGKGNVLNEQGRADAALAAYDRALQADPQNRFALVGKSYLLCQQGAYDAAAQLCDLAEQVVPTFAPLWRNRGNIARGRRDLPLALRHYNRAIELDAQFASPWRNKGIIFREQGDDVAAVAAFHVALTIDSTYTRAWYDLVRTYRTQKDPTNALRTLEEAMHHLGDDTALRQLRDEILRDQLRTDDQDDIIPEPMPQFKVEEPGSIEEVPPADRSQQEEFDQD